LVSSFDQTFNGIGIGPAGGAGGPPNVNIAVSGVYPPQGAGGQQNPNQPPVGTYFPCGPSSAPPHISILDDGGGGNQFSSMGPCTDPMQQQMMMGGGKNSFVNANMPIQHSNNSNGPPYG